jgi:hypothetical protein
MNKYIKLLFENLSDLFDDSEVDITDIFDNPNIINPKNDLKELCLKTLCINSDYHTILPEDPEDGFTQVKDDPKDESSFYAGIIGTYKTCNLGPRKRKGYPISYFYKYKITLNDDGTCSIKTPCYNTNNSCSISQPLINFITDNVYMKIRDITYYNGRLSNNQIYINNGKSGFLRIFIINNNSPKFQKNFVDNFPIIYPFALSDEQNKLIPVIQRSEGLTSIYKRSFENDEQFITLVEKLVNMGYYVKDENAEIYTKDNIEEKKNNLLSGKFYQEQDIKKSKELEFVISQIGQDYVDKLDKIINYFNNVILKDSRYKF